VVAGVRAHNQVVVGVELLIDGHERGIAEIDGHILADRDIPHVVLASLKSDDDVVVEADVAIGARRNRVGSRLAARAANREVGSIVR